MAVKPMLGDLPLQLVDEIESDQDRLLVQHPVPGLEGDFTSDLGTRSTTITLSGAVEGEQVGDELKKLREKFQAHRGVADFQTWGTTQFSAACDHGPPNERCSDAQSQL